MNNEQVKNFIIQQRQNGIPDAEIVSFLNSKGVNLQAQQEKSGSLVGNIIKDVGETLLVKPAARATEAATRLFAPNSVAARGYEAMADEGESQKILGIDVEAQKGVGGGRQIAGEALKTASYLFPYGKVAKGAGSLVGSKIAGNVASGVAGGYTADVGYNLTDEEKTVGESFVPGAGTIIGGAVPLVGPTVRGAGRLTKKTGEKIVDVVIPASKREAQILQTYRANNPFLKRVGDVLSNIDSSPTTAGKTVARTKAGQTIPGLFGTKSQIGVQAKRATKTLWEDVISPKLKESGQAVDLDGFFSKVQDDIIKNNPDLTRQKVLLKALQGIKNDYSGVNSISLEKLQKLKEGWAKPVPETAYSGKPISSAINDVRKQLSDEARGTIYDVLGDDVKQAYLDYGNLLGIQDMGVASMTGQKLKAGAGNFVSEVFSQAVTPIGTIAGQAIYRLGKGIEFVGNLGATNLGQALGVNLKFPGDAAIDDISKTIKKAKSLPNQQGGFIKIGYDASLPTATQSSQTANKVKNTVIPKSSPKSTKKSIDPLINEAKKYKSADFNPSTSYLKRNIEVLNKNGIKVKNPDEVITLYHGTNEAGVKGITESGSLKPSSFLATDPNASKGFVFGKGGKVLKIKVRVKDLGFVQDGGMAGSKGVSVQTIDKLVKRKDGIYKAEISK